MGWSFLSGMMSPRVESGLPCPVVFHESAADDVADVYPLAVDLIGQRAAETVVRGAQGDEGFPGVEVIDEMLELVVRQGEQADREDDKIRLREMLGAGDAVRLELRLLAFSGYTGAVGSTKPSPFTPKSTVQSKPWCFERMPASIGM